MKLIKLQNDMRHCEKPPGQDLIPSREDCCTKYCKSVRTCTRYSRKKEADEPPRWPLRSASCVLRFRGWCMCELICNTVAQIDTMETHEC